MNAAPCLTSHFSSLHALVRRLRLAFAGMAAATLLGGCLSAPESVTAAAWERDMGPLWAQSWPVGETAAPQAIVTLGAGDALGWAIHTNDVVLAALEELRAPDEPQDADAFASVPTNED